jgi:beta-lactamase regulating signal transducer with metallopeptidase domain
MDTVLNWLWQGMVVAIALAVSLRLLRRVRASSRCVICWVALILVAALPAIASVASAAAGEAWSFIPAEALVSVPQNSWLTSNVLAGAWLVWVGVNAAMLARVLIVLRRARAGAAPFPEHLASRLHHWSRVRRMGRRPALVTSDAVATAAVIGGGTPMIAVAAELLARLDDEELDRVLVHEWAHVQRRDDLLSILQLLVRVVAGWHPAAWWIDRRLHLEREAACDEVVVAVSGSPKSYAMCLVKLAGLRADRAAMLAAPAIRGGGLHDRVARIVARRVSLSRPASRAVTALVVCALCVVSLAAGTLTIVDAEELPLPLRSRWRTPDLATAPRAVVGFTGLRESPQSAHAPVPSLEPLRRAPVESAQPDAGEAGETPPPASPAAEPSNDARPLPPAAAAPGPEALGPTTVDEPPPAEPSALKAAPSTPPWTHASDFGVAVGQRSSAAGVATAGAFRRFAKRIAGSF